MHIMSKLSNSIKTLPDSPGVYFFKKEGVILYVGKATSLRDRVKSYFSKDLATTRGPLIVSLIEKADSIDFEKTDSVLEALILEANLIKKYRPEHNTMEKDDKSWNYVVITKERWPRVETIRGKNLYDMIEQGKAEIGGVKIAHSFGPFTQGLSLREALKIVRRIFPYRDSRCIPYNERLNPSPSTLNPTPKPCFKKATRA